MELELSLWNREVSGFTDSQLVARMQQLTGADRKLVARLIVCLGEIDARGLYRDQACSSMFKYLVHELRMSDAEAYLRLQAARLARTYPVVVEMIASGRVHLTALALVSRLVTPENHVQLLERVCGKTKREVQQLVAELDPKPDVPAALRKLPQRRQPLSAAAMNACMTLEVQAASTSNAPAATLEMQTEAAPVCAAVAMHSASRVVGAAVQAAVSTAVAAVQAQTAASTVGAMSDDDAGSASDVSMPRLMIAPPLVPANAASAFALEMPVEKRGSCAPLGRGRYRLQVTASQGLHDKLEQLQHLLRHQVPNGDLGVIVERALDLLLKTTLKQRFAQTAARKPRSGQTAACTGLCAREPSSGQPSSDQPTALVQQCSGAHHAGAHHAGEQRSGEQRSGEQRLGEQRSGEQRSGSDARARVSAISDDSSRASGTDRSVACNGRYIPRAVLREVFARDAGQCAFVAENGRRCSERGALEVHHVIPFARGGEARVGNLKLACRAHNRLWAERDFGRDFMRQKCLLDGAPVRANGSASP